MNTGFDLVDKGLDNIEKAFAGSGGYHAFVGPGKQGGFEFVFQFFKLLTDRRGGDVECGRGGGNTLEEKM